MLMQNGVDGNAVTRLLLQSSKPSLHANVDCNSLAAAVVSRQTSIVQLLLKVINNVVNILFFLLKIILYANLLSEFLFMVKDGMQN